MFRELFYLSMLIFFWTFAFTANDREFDSTDKGTKRSGMELHIDNLTGCHYLAPAWFFGTTLIPRVDANGNHICTGQE